MYQINYDHLTSKLSSFRSAKNPLETYTMQVAIHISKLAVQHLNIY